MKDHTEWDYIRKNLELKPGIKSLSDYNAAIQRGEKAAKEFLTQLDRIVFYEEHIRATHWALFNEVHPWAGELRSGEILIAGRMAAVPKKIWEELKMLGERAETWFDKTLILDKVMAIAAYHTAFEQIHPFLDGNGRVGRRLLSAQAERELGKAVDLAADKERYHEVIEAAAEGHKLNMLRDMIIDHAQIADRIRTGDIDNLLVSSDLIEVPTRKPGMEEKLDALGRKLRHVVAETSPLTEEEIRLIREAAVMRAEQSMPNAEIEPEKKRDNELDP